MRVRWLALAALMVALAAGVASGAKAPGSALATVPSGYVEVQFDTGRTLESLGPDGKPPTLSEQGFQLLAVPPGLTREEFAAQLRQRPDVLQAEPSVPVHAAATPNDPYYATTQTSNQAQYLQQIGTPAAWDLATGGGQVVVAVVDSGTDVTHPDLSSRLWENPVDNRGDGVDRDGNGCVNDRYGCRFVSLNQRNQAACGYAPGSSAPNNAILDDMGAKTPDNSNIGSHGTLVAGVIAAAGNNSIGIAGVAWNARIMTVKVLDCLGSGESFDVGFGIEYAVRAGARIINVSIEVDAAKESPTLRNAIQLAQNAGAIVVAAAGNHLPGEPVGTAYPAAYMEFPNMIAVGAADNLNGNHWAPYSNYGPAIDFAAPASRIISTARTDVLPNPYAEIGSPLQGYGGGTSFAAPLVSGMFALMMSRNSRLSTAEYIQIARDAATPVEPAPHGQNWAGSGLINIGQAVARVPLSASGTPLQDWNETVPPGTTIEAIIDGIVCGSTQTIAFGLADRYDILVRSTAEQPNCGQPGKTVQFFIGGLPAQPVLPWAAPNQDLANPGVDISSVTPPPGSIVVQTFNGGWSNVAHLDPGGQLPGAAAGLPTPWNSIFKWDPLKRVLDRPGAYLRFFRGLPGFVNDFPTIVQYDAYWVDAPEATIGTLNPQPQSGRVIELKAGWNNFVYTGTSRSVHDALGSINGKYTQVLKYDNATATWLSHLPQFVPNQRYLNDFGGLATLSVYWVYLSEDAALVMN